MSDIIEQYVELFSRELSDKTPECVVQTLRKLTEQGLISDAIAEQVAQRFAEPTLAVARGITETSQQPVQLEIDWGMKPKVGMELRPHFRLLTGPKKCLDIVVLIDTRLEHEPHAALPTFRSSEAGRYEFYAAFRTMCHGQPCLPGQYTIDLFILLQTPESDDHVVLHGSLLLNVIDAGSANAPVLEIVSGEQSLINLQGLDVERFAKVVARAETAGLINVVSRPLAPNAEPCSNSEGLELQKRTVTQQCELKPISFTADPLPRQIKCSDVPAIERAMLRLDNGQRWILIPFATPSHYVKFGRDRWPSNDITLRHLPRTPANDGQSLKISRTHFRLGMDDHGLMITDHSANGLIVDGVTVKEYRLTRLARPTDEIRLELGTGDLLTRFELGLVVAAGRRGDRQETILRQRFLAKLLGCVEPPDIWQRSVDFGIQSVGIYRRTNACGETYHVLLEYVDFAYDSPRQQLELATSSTDSVARVIFARRRFWLEKTAVSCPISVDGVYLHSQTIVGLRSGNRIKIGDVEACFEQISQLGLE